MATTKELAPPDVLDKAIPVKAEMIKKDTAPTLSLSMPIKKNLMMWIMAHLKSSWLREVGRWVLVIVGIMGIAAFILFLIFGVVVGLSYLVEALYR